MRILFETSEEENTHYIEIHLSDRDIEKIQDYKLLEKDIGDLLLSDKNINIAIRRVHAFERR